MAAAAVLCATLLVLCNTVAVRTMCNTTAVLYATLLLLLCVEHTVARFDLTPVSIAFWFQRRSNVLCLRCRTCAMRNSMSKNSPANKCVKCWMMTSVETQTHALGNQLPPIISARGHGWAPGCVVWCDRCRQSTCALSSETAGG